ncbi:aminotransferase class V-fold PLP-dependent enzyme [Gynurincola endophyticus]|uniref:aminotransferase class V-fold PLP-dependent enzyme n=1 Tax=Gynurincola endophyticus TaxID=2479004 RepID=UPI000F8D29D6|nr:aminotransferase class V-fold PLP-dependent enzyme [Gynurincola endophyticus]
MNIDQIRQHTAGCNDKIFLNSAGASLMPKEVTTTMIDYLQQEELIGGYKLEAFSSALIREFYTEAAKLLNTKENNIAFTYNATDAYAKALSAIPFQSGDYLLTTNNDYISNQIAFLSLKKRFNINIVRVDNNQENDIDTSHFEELIKKYQPRLVAVTHIPTNSGLIQQVEAIGTLCEKYDVLYLVDACQSVGQLTVDVQKIKCDFLSATGRKFLRGPRGTGLLYVSDKVLQRKLEPLLLDMRGADWIDADKYTVQMTAKRFELWETSYVSLLGLKEAIKYANHVGLENIHEYNRLLSQRLRNLLRENDSIQVLDKGTNLSSIITFNTAKRNLTDIEGFLQQHNIYYSVSYKRAALIDFEKKGVEWAIRFSPHYFNTTEEIDTVAKIVNENI